MADRQTAAIYCASHGRDVMLYAPYLDCLSAARDLALVIGGEGSIHVVDDDGWAWVWRAQPESEG